MVDEFNRLYRTKKTAITDEEVMEEMVKSKTYTFHRNPTSWWVETVLSTERYVYRQQELEKDVYYIIIDTHQHKHVEIIPCNLGPIGMTGLRDMLSDNAINAYFETVVKLKLYNEEFEYYNEEMIDFIILGNLTSTGR